MTIYLSMYIPTAVTEEERREVQNSTAADQQKVSLPVSGMHNCYIGRVSSLTLSSSPLVYINLGGVPRFAYI